MEGKLFITVKQSDLQERTIELAPRQGFVVPKGIMHRTRAAERTVVLMFESAGVLPTGN